MHRRAGGLSILVVVLLVGGCRSTSDAAPSQAAAPPEPSRTGTVPASDAGVVSSTADAPGGTTELTIGTPASNETLYLPDTATVTSGRVVRLLFTNSSNAPHNVTFDAPIGAATDPYIEPGEWGAVTFTAPAPGDYEFYCTLHPWMTGTLIVTP